MASNRDARLFAFSSRFIHTSRAWRQLADTALAPLRLSYSTTQPLLFVHRLGGAPRQTALAAAVGIEGPSLVRLLDQLSAAGLLTRGDDPTDRRAKIIQLTPSGAALVAQAEAALTAERARVMADVDDKDLETAIRVLDAVAAGIERQDVAA